MCVPRISSDSVAATTSDLRIPAISSIYNSSTSFAMPLTKVDNKKPAKSTVSGIPSMAISTTRSGKIISDFYQVSGKKAGSRPLESSKGAAASPPSSPNDTHKTPEFEAQNPPMSMTGAQASPPSQEGDALAPY